jgi:hypothetical protein
MPYDDDSKDFVPLLDSIKGVLDAIDQDAAQEALEEAVQGLRAQYTDYARLCRRAHVTKDPDQQP